MATQIRPNRLEVSDRFPMLGFTVRTDGSAKRYEIICFAHVTNRMGQSEGDFEKGEAQGAQTSLDIICQTAHSWRVRCL